jgi:uncharacterized protein (TIGR02246 family)
MKVPQLIAIAALAALPLTAQEASDTEAALDALAQKYIDAWSKGDAAAAAAIYSDEARVTDFTGNTVEGRAAIEQALSESLKTFQGSTIQLERTNLSAVAPGIAVSDGTWEVKGASSAEGPTKGFYTVVAKKTGDEWALVASQSKVPPPMPSN